MDELSNNFPTFLYLSYGSWQFRKQAILSIQSLIVRKVPLKNIVVFTDYPDEFRDVSAEIIPATKSQIKEWQGRFAYPHRLKIELIRYVFNKFERSLLYIDSDTIWLNDPTRICNLLDNGCLVMYEKEQMLSESFFPEYLRVMKKKDLLEKGGFVYREPEELWIYNTGVIGLPKEFNSEILDQILYFCDFLSMNVSSRTEWVEQLAFSYILERVGRIETCEKDIFHYWSDSFEFCRQIKAYSNSMLLQLCQDKEQINFLISKGRSFRRNFGNQFLLRAKRLRYSCKKRRSEWLIFLEKIKLKLCNKKVR